MSMGTDSAGCAVAAVAVFMLSLLAILITPGCCAINEKQPVVKEQIVLPEAKRGEVDVITIYE